LELLGGDPIDEHVLNEYAKDAYAPSAIQDNYLYFATSPAATTSPFGNLRREDGDNAVTANGGSSGAGSPTTNALLFSSSGPAAFSIQAHSNAFGHFDDPNAPTAGAEGSGLGGRMAPLPLTPSASPQVEAQSQDRDHHGKNPSFDFYNLYLFINMLYNINRFLNA
jgi:hypothetical protein